MTGRFRANSPQTIHQTIDGEVVIINLATGNYYSLRRSGARIWDLLMTGHSPAEVASTLQDGYGSVDGEIERSVSRLVAELEAEGLVVPAGDTPASSTASISGVPEASERFEPPTLEKFDDMQDLILLDPVHEVDQEEGWPHARPGPQA